MNHEDNTNDDKLTVEQWFQIRKDEGLRIVPGIAEVFWKFAQTLDPYCVNLELAENYSQVGREDFASSPGSDIWVSFRDLSKVVREKIWKMIDEKMAESEETPCWL